MEWTNADEGSDWNDYWMELIRMPGWCKDENINKIQTTTQKKDHNNKQNNEICELFSNFTNIVHKTNSSVNVGR